MKGTLLESTAGGPGGGAVPAYYQPGIVSKLFEPLGVADLFGSSQTTGSQVRYVNEGTATSGAAGVPEAGLKPESTIGLSEISEPVKKVATLLPVSDELLEDAPSIQSYLNERLSLFVSIEVERQLLRGNGTNELVGLFNRSGNQAISTYTRLAVDDNTVALAKVIANTRGSANIEPDAIIMHPSNWLSSRLLRDGAGGTVGQYYGGGPFSYEEPRPRPGCSSTRCGTSGWCSRPSSARVPHWSAASAKVRTCGEEAARASRPVTAIRTFRTNLTAIRAEARLALGVFRPSAFTAVTGLV